MILISNTKNPTNVPWTEALKSPAIFERTLTHAVGYPERQAVSNSERLWQRPCPGYAPPFYEAPRVLAQDRTIVTGGWADPANVSAAEFRLWVKSGAMKSFEGPVMLDPLSGRPLNPLGRSGIEGRGLLGKWGPNHAADGIVTRISQDTGLLEVLLILRGSGEWAIPGGMVDQGEDSLQSSYREVFEETGVNLEGEIPQLIYQGIGDGPRLTDNAWIETSAYHFHLKAESLAAKSSPKGMSDALDAHWATVSADLIATLYANHGELLAMTLAQMGCSDKDLSTQIREQLGTIPHVPLLTNFSALSGEIALIGGSFDPVHNAHIKIGQRALETGLFNSIIYIPTSHNPLKDLQTGALPRERIEMLCYDLAEHDRMFVSPIEAQSDGDGYTIDTIRKIREQLHPERARLNLIIGSDCLSSLSKWKEIETLLELVTIIPIGRAGEPDFRKNPELRGELIILFGEARYSQLEANFIPPLDQAGSSTAVREHLAKGIGKPDDISESVYQYSLTHGLYS